MPKQPKLLSLKEIAEGLKDKRLYVVAKKINVSYPTLKKFLDKKTHNFTIDTLAAVSKYLKSIKK